MSKAGDLTKLKSLLDEEHEFPFHYTFKFIILTENKDELLSLLKEHNITEKLSKNGKYTSITSHTSMNSSDEIVEVYQVASTVEGIFSL
jgi:putative lipoic acid-binding regulatory protein